MKIALLSGGATIHTIRWANGLAQAGHQVHLITQHPLLEAVDESVVVHEFAFRGTLGYFQMAPAVKRLLKQIKPHILNAHYASGYGTTARLVGFHPYLLSVWGSDVYDVPRQSFLHKYWVAGNLRAADAIASTSHCMAEQTRKVAPGLGDIAITPFGVDVERFYVNSAPKVAGESGKIVIGTIKKLGPKYGIDTLIEAFALIVARYRSSNAQLAAQLELRIVGEGPQREELEALAKKLNIHDQVNFLGRVPHAQVPDVLAQIDIYVALSRLDSESFGVAIIEAGAAGRPVVVSDAGGLPEVVVAEKTGLVVPRNNPERAAEAISRLIEDSDLRVSMGQQGRQHVEKHYSWSTSVQLMVDTLSRVSAMASRKT